MKNTLLILIILLFGSCTTTKKLETKIEIKTEYVELVKDTTIYIEDMAYFKAFLECDSLNHVVIKELENYKHLHEIYHVFNKLMNNDKFIYAFVTFFVSILAAVIINI